MRHNLFLRGLVCVLGTALPLPAANRFFIENQTVPKGGMGIGILLKADIDVERNPDIDTERVLGFSFGINYDETALTVTAVTVEGTSIAPSALVEDESFFAGTIDPARGLVGYGCVLDFLPPFADSIPSGNNYALAKLVVDVIGAGGTSSPMSLETVPTNPDPDRPVKNVMTNDEGTSIIPTLLSGTITIEDRTPQITLVSGNSGPGGTVFQVEGLFFGEPGLAVKVGGAAAAATLRLDGTTLDVTAPPCASPGTKPVEVCTVWGCDTEESGFACPDEPPPGGSQKPLDENQDGKMDISDAVSVLNHLFLGTNPTLPCGDGTPGDAGNIALLDSNHDNRVDLSDPVHLLAFLFTGGPVPFPCAGDPSCPCKLIVGCPDNPKCE